MAKVQEKSIIGGLLNVDSYQKYVVPIYQRDYTWQPENITNLIDDLLDFEADRSRRDLKEVSYYVGSIATRKESPDQISTLTVLVDGQQRLISFILIMSAIAQLKRRNGTADADDFLAKLHSYVFSMGRTGNNSLRIELDSDVSNNLQKVLTMSEPPEGEHESDSVNMVWKNYTAAVDFISERPGNTVDVLRDLHSAINRCVFAHVELQSTDDESRIFETINSRGVKLKQSDLIKNYLYTVSSKYDQDRNFSQWFKNVVSKVGRKYADEFFRACILIKKPNRPFTVRHAYHEFRNFVEELISEGSALKEVLNFMNDIEDYASIFDLRPKIKPLDTTEKHLLYLTILKPQFKTFFTLFVHLVTHYKALDDEWKYKEIVRIVAKLILYRSFGPNKTRDITSLVPTIFSNFPKARISKDPRDFEEWLDLVDGEKYRYPNYRQMIEDAKSYRAGNGSRNTNAKNILWAYEYSINSAVGLDINGTKSKKATLEHFYPQTPAVWNSHRHSDEIYVNSMNERRNKLGNLFLVKGKLNIEMKDDWFERKKEKMLKQTSFHMLKLIEDLDDWQPADIDRRTLHIAEMVYALPRADKDSKKRINK